MSWSGFKVEAQARVHAVYRDHFNRSWYRWLFVWNESSYMERLRARLDAYDATSKGRGLRWNALVSWWYGFDGKRRLLGLYDLEKQLMAWSDDDVLPGWIKLDKAMGLSYQLGFEAIGDGLQRYAQGGVAMKDAADHEDGVELASFTEDLEQKAIEQIESCLRLEEGISIREMGGAFFSYFQLKKAGLCNGMVGVSASTISRDQVRMFSIQNSIYAVIEGPLREQFYPIIRQIHALVQDTKYPEFDEGSDRNQAGKYVSLAWRMYRDRRASYEALCEKHEALVQCGCDEQSNPRVYQVLKDVYGKRWTELSEAFTSRIKGYEEKLSGDLERLLDQVGSRHTQMIEDRTRLLAKKETSWYNRWVGIEKESVFLNRFNAAVVQPLVEVWDVLRSSPAPEGKQMRRTLIKFLELWYVVKRAYIARENYDFRRSMDEVRIGLAVAAQKKEQALIEMPVECRMSARKSDRYKRQLERRYEQVVKALGLRSDGCRHHRDQVLQVQRMGALGETRKTYDDWKKRLDAEPARPEVRLSCELLSVNKYTEYCVNALAGSKQAVWLSYPRSLNHFLIYYVEKEGTWHVMGRDSRGVIHQMAIDIRDAGSVWYRHRDIFMQLNGMWSHTWSSTYVEEVVCAPLLQTLSAVLHEAMVVDEVGCQNETAEMDGPFYFRAVKLLEDLLAEDRWSIVGLYEGAVEEMPTKCWQALVRSSLADRPSRPRFPLGGRNYYSQPSRCGEAVIEGVSYPMDQWVPACVQERDEVGGEAGQVNVCRQIVSYDEAWARQQVEEADWITPDEWLDYRFYYARMEFDRTRSDFEWQLIITLRKKQCDQIDVWMAGVRSDRKLQNLFHVLKGWYDEIHVMHPDQFNVVMKGIHPEAQAFFADSFLEHQGVVRKNYALLKDLLRDDRVLREYVHRNYISCLYRGEYREQYVVEADMLLQLYQERYLKTPDTLRYFKEQKAKQAEYRRSRLATLAKIEEDKRLTEIAKRTAELYKQEAAAANLKVLRLEAELKAAKEGKVTSGGDLVPAAAGLADQGGPTPAQIAAARERAEDVEERAAAGSQADGAEDAPAEWLSAGLN